MSKHVDNILEVAKKALLENGFNVEGQELEASESYSFDKEELDFLPDDGMSNDTKLTTHMGGFMNGEQQMLFTVIMNDENTKFLYLHIMDDEEQDPTTYPAIDINKYN